MRQLERSLEEEVKARTTREKALRDEVEKKLDEIKVYSDEGLNGIRKMTEVRAMTWTVDHVAYRFSVK